MRRKFECRCLRWAGLLLCIGLSIPGARSEDSTLEELGWMVGSWAGAERGIEMEELWTAPRGGAMLGLHRDVFPNGKMFFEYLRIESGPQGITYLASPRGAAPTPFHLVRIEGKKAVFENPEHDWPKRITYALEGGALCSYVEGDEGQRKSRWCWKRVEQGHVPSR